jgi:hypothetical protein
LAAAAHATCDRPVLKQQRRDASTIRRLETAWSAAYLSGDVEFERCLLTPDFTEIMSDGNINHLTDELTLAERNKNNPATAPAMPAITILLYENVAVAYGISSVKTVDGKPYKSYFADYYVWASGGWRVYFAEQTSFPVMNAKTDG